MGEDRIDLLRPIPRCADLVAAQVVGNFRSFQRVNDSVSKSSIRSRPQKFGSGGNCRLLGMNFGFCETLDERDAAIGATRESGPILRSTVGAEHEFLGAPRPSGRIL